MRTRGTGLTIVLALCLLATGLLPVGGAETSPAVSPTRSVTVVNGTWSGYMVSTGKLHSVTQVNGSWIVPRLNSSCKSPPGNVTSEFYAGIGLDGLGPAASSFEFLGIWGDCVAGSGARHYGVALEDNSLTRSPSMKILAGNVISAEISFVSGRLEFALTNHNTSSTYWFNASRALSKVPRETADWLTEAGITVRLAPYGAVEFGPAYTHLTGTDTMTAFSATHSIGDHPTVYRFVEKSWVTRGVAATPTPLIRGASFASTWQGY